VSNANSDSNPDRSRRDYVVLEADNVANLIDRAYPEHFAGELPQDVWDGLERIQVYVKIGTVEARNTEHALQQAGLSAMADRHPRLVPIASRHFHEETITVDRSPRVVID
jgi:hypothetical protein